MAWTDHPKVASFRRRGRVLDVAVETLAGFSRHHDHAATGFDGSGDHVGVSMVFRTGAGGNEHTADQAGKGTVGVSHVDAGLAPETRVDFLIAIPTRVRPPVQARSVTIFDDCSRVRCTGQRSAIRSRLARWSSSRSPSRWSTRVN